MLAQIFATFGLAVFLRSAVQAIWGVDFLVVKTPLVEGRISVGGLFLGLPRLVASVDSLAAFAGLHLFISRTETGLALQATSQDRQAASLMGSDTPRMFALGWGIGAGCVGVAARPHGLPDAPDDRRAVPGAAPQVVAQISQVITRLNRERRADHRVHRAERGAGPEPGPSRVAARAG